MQQLHGIIDNLLCFIILLNFIHVYVGERTETASAFSVAARRHMTPGGI